MGMWASTLFVIDVKYQVLYYPVLPYHTCRSSHHTLRLLPRMQQQMKKETKEVTDVSGQGNSLMTYSV